MSKRKSKAAAPDMSGCAGCRHYFESSGPELLQAEHPRLRLHTGRGAQAALPRGRGAARCPPMPQGFSSYRRRHRAIIEAFMLARSRPGRAGFEKFCTTTWQTRRAHFGLPALQKAGVHELPGAQLRTAHAQGRTGGRRAGAQSSTASPGRRK